MSSRSRRSNRYDCSSFRQGTALESVQEHVNVHVAFVGYSYKITSRPKQLKVRSYDATLSRSEFVLICIILILHLQEIGSLGVSVVEDPKDYHKITHLVVKDDQDVSIDRFKFASACCNIEHIVRSDWIRQSIKEGRLLRERRFHVSDVTVGRQELSVKDTIANSVNGKCFATICMAESERAQPLRSIPLALQNSKLAAILLSVC